MKKRMMLVLTVVAALCLTACGGRVKNVRITERSSEIYTASDIDDAINVTLDYFKKEFSGCTLTEIAYIGDEKMENYWEYAQRGGAEDVIVLISSFDVDASGGDGSLNPNSTYVNWSWILIRDAGGEWRHLDHGYG